MNQYAIEGFTPPHLLSGMAESTPILIALSGGADSSALLFALDAYAGKHGTPLAVAHVDHKLRGAESDADREFCRSLAESYGLPFYLLEADVRSLAQAHHRGVEEEARQVRYQFFAALMKEHGIPLLATAHNADDNAETVLFHLCRGSGLRGLCGIPATRAFGEGTLIRPLLGVPKQRILDFCEQNRIPYVTDATNKDTCYARNRIRHNVLPELTAINSGARDNISRLCTSLRQDEEFISSAVSQFLNRHEADGSLPLDALVHAPAAIASRAVASLLSRLTEDVRAVHIEAVLELARAAVPHSTVHLSDGIAASVENGSLVIAKKTAPQRDISFYYEVGVGETEIPEANMTLIIENAAGSHKNHQTLKNIYKKSTTTKISSDRIYGSLSVRNRREGDSLLSCGMHKKIKKLMCDRKLPLPLRNRLPLLEDGQGILWVPSIALRDGAADGKEALTFTLYYSD